MLPAVEQGDDAQVGGDQGADQQYPDVAQHVQPHRYLLRGFKSHLCTIIGALLRQQRVPGKKFQAVQRSTVSKTSSCTVHHHIDRTPTLFVQSTGPVLQTRKPYFLTRAPTWTRFRMAIFGSVVAGGSTSASTSRCIAADAAAAAALASLSFASARMHIKEGQSKSSLGAAPWFWFTLRRHGTHRSPRRKPWSRSVSVTIHSGGGGLQW